MRTAPVTTTLLIHLYSNFTLQSFIPSFTFVTSALHSLIRSHTLAFSLLEHDLHRHIIIQIVAVEEKFILELLAQAEHANVLWLESLALFAYLRDVFELEVLDALQV